SRSVARTDLVLVSVDQHIQRCRIDVSLLFEQSAQRSDSNLHLILMVMIVSHDRFYTVPPAVPLSCRKVLTGRLPTSCGEERTWAGLVIVAVVGVDGYCLQGAEHAVRLIVGSGREIELVGVGCRLYPEVNRPKTGNLQRMPPRVGQLSAEGAP